MKGCGALEAPWYVDVHQTAEAFMTEQRWHSLIGMALVLGSVSALSARAQSSVEKYCMTAVDVSLDDRVAGCTAVIESERSAPPIVVSAYFARAAAYFRKGDLDNAIADYDRIIQRAPTEFSSRDRPDIHPRGDDPVLAIAVSDRTLEPDLRSAHAYRGRGIASFQAGLLVQSQDDFRQLSELDPKDPYAALWLDLARRRGGVASELAGAAGRFDMQKWPAPIVRFFLGQESLDAVLAAAADPNPVKRRTHVCEASFFAGELLLQQGVEASAMRLIDRALADCPPTSGERSVADADARMLSVVP
jgi:tetratricopeptide (TPR) repeat protein